MGCTTCSGNPNTWCTQCMPAEDTWVAPVDKLPDVFMGDRDHMYLLPNGDLYILSPDRTRWIKVNGVGGGETVVYKAGDGINIAPDKTIVNTKPNKDQTLTLSGRTLSISDGNSVQLPESAEVSVVAGKRIKVTKEGNAYTVSGIPIGVVKLIEKDKNPLVTLEASGNDDNILRFSTVALTQKITELEKKKQTISKQGNKIVLSNDGGEVELPTAGGSVSYDDTFLRNEIKELKSKSTTPVTFMAKGDIPGAGNDQNIRVTKDDVVNAGTIKVGDTVVDTNQFRDKFNIGMFKVASVDGNNIVLNGINDLNFTTYKQTLTLSDRTLSISGGNSVTLPAQGVSTQDFNNLKNEYNQLKGAFEKLLQDLKGSGAWKQTGGTIFEGNLYPDRHIATGNINLFGGTVDGSAFIRTNNGKTENDLAGGIN